MVAIDDYAPIGTRCLRCASDCQPSTSAVEPSHPERKVYHCDQCDWDFETVPLAQQTEPT
jgi:hypothetical protein